MVKRAVFSVAESRVSGVHVFYLDDDENPRRSRTTLVDPKSRPNLPTTKCKPRRGA